MKAFQVRLNGQQVCTAGVEEGGIASVVLSWWSVNPPHPPSPDGRFSLIVYGVDPASGSWVDWPMPDVSVGDEVSVKILEANHAEPEPHHSKHPPGATTMIDERLRRTIQRRWMESLQEKRSASEIEADIRDLVEHTLDALREGRPSPW